jgi:hypothetical protein
MTATSFEQTPTEVFARTALGDGVVEYGSQLLTHEMKLLLVMVDGRTGIQQLASALPQVAHVPRVMAELLKLGFVRPQEAGTAAGTTNQPPLRHGTKAPGYETTLTMHGGDSRVNWQPTVVVIDDDKARGSGLEP